MAKLLLFIVVVALLVSSVDGRRRRSRRRAPPPEPRPEPAAPAGGLSPEGTCNLAGRDGGTCTAESVRYCGPGGTSAWGVCRQQYVRYCETPERETSVESCLVKRCDSLPGSPGHPAAMVRGVCRNGGQGGGGMRELCGRQSCKTAPTFPQTCDLAAKDAGTCEAEAVRYCGAGGTSAWGVCRQQYVRFCTAPTGEPNLETCLQKRCDSLPGSPGHPETMVRSTCRTGGNLGGGMAALCARQCCQPTTAKPTPAPEPVEKPCVIKCRASALDSCGVSDAADRVECRRRYMLGCVDEECHNRRRNRRTVSPAVARAEAERLAKIAEREKFLKSEIPCDVICKMQAYKKCGVTMGHSSCRRIYRKDCNNVQCKVPKCETDCRIMSFSACGTGEKFEMCREDYRELCLPIRCRRITCMRESLLECGARDCRADYVKGCMKRKTRKWKKHSEELKKIPSAFSSNDD